MNEKNVLSAHETEMCEWTVGPLDLIATLSGRIKTLCGTIDKLYFETVNPSVQCKSFDSLI